MNNNWNYAKLSAMAKQNGGPEELVNKLFKSAMEKGYKIGYAVGDYNGYNRGVRDTLCVVFIIAGVSIFVYLAHKLYIKKVVKLIKNIPSNELENVKKHLIEGIENYDKENNK